MTLEEASKILYVLSIEYTGREAIKEYDALNLGIEALKQILFYDSIPDGKRRNLLLGETKD